MFLLGHWKNFQDLEESLSLDELMATLKAIRDREHRQNKFVAAMQGIDIDEHSKKESMERVVEEMRKIEEASQEVSPLPRDEKAEYAKFGLAIMED